MIDTRLHERTPGRGARTGAAGTHDPVIRIALASREAKVLREILAEDLHALEAEIAGNDWQDLGAEVLLREELLRKLVGHLAV